MHCSRYVWNQLEELLLIHYLPQASKKTLALYSLLGLTLEFALGKFSYLGLATGHIKTRRLGLVTKTTQQSTRVENQQWKLY